MQELVLTARVVRYRGAMVTPDGETIVAPLPAASVAIWAGATPLVLMQYHQGQVTVERLVRASGDRRRHLQASGHAPAMTSRTSF